MADVEMTDAAPKKAKAGPSGGDTADGKKKFEVKKVSFAQNKQRDAHIHTQRTCSLTSLVRGCDIVERSRSVGLGHCSRQLRHLPQSHYGLVYRLPGQSSQCHQRGVYGRLGDLQCKFTFAERGSQSWSCKANKVVVVVEL